MDPDEFFLHTLDGGGNTPLDQLSVKTSAKLLEVCILLKSGFGRLIWAAGLGGWSSSRRETALRCGGLLLAVGDSLSRGPRVTRHARHARHHA